PLRAVLRGEGGATPASPPRSPTEPALAACRRGCEPGLRRDLPQDELVVAEQRRRDRRDHARTVERRQVLLLDCRPHLVHEALADLPLRLDRRSKLIRLHRSELLDQRLRTRHCHLRPPLVEGRYPGRLPIPAPVRSSGIRPFGGLFLLRRAAVRRGATPSSRFAEVGRRSPRQRCLRSGTPASRQGPLCCFRPPPSRCSSLPCCR